MTQHDFDTLIRVIESREDRLADTLNNEQARRSSRAMAGAERTQLQRIRKELLDKRDLLATEI